MDEYVELFKSNVNTKSNDLVYLTWHVDKMDRHSMNVYHSFTRNTHDEDKKVMMSMMMVD